MLVVQKSVADYVQRRWGTPAIRKSETRREKFLQEGDPAFEWYKKRIMSLIKERINAADEGRLEKAGYAIGTPRVWKDGNTYVKVAPNKWRRKYDASNEGGYHHKTTLTRFYKRIAGCTDEREIQATIRSFVLQFRDASGYPMKWVPDFLGDARKALADAKRMSNPAAADKIEQGHREFAKKRGYSGARNFNYEDDAQSGGGGGEPPDGGDDGEDGEDDDVSKSATVEETISTLKDVLTSGKDAFIKNKTLGNIKITMGDYKAGLRHIIKRHIEERLFEKNSNCSLDNALEETAAILILLGEGIKKKEANKNEQKDRYKLVYHGINAIFSKDDDGHYLLTGFAYNKTETPEDIKMKTSAEDAIKAVNDNYGYAPDFLDLYDRVGAEAADAITSLVNDEKKASRIEQIAEEFFQLEQGREKLDDEYFMLYEREKEISSAFEQGSITKDEYDRSLKELNKREKIIENAKENWDGGYRSKIDLRPKSEEIRAALTVAKVTRESAKRQATGKHTPIKKFDAQNFASNDADRMHMGGVHYENGFKIVTDGRQMVFAKDNYEGTLEGKTIRTDKKGTREIEGQFPSWRGVIPKKENLTSYEIDYDALNDAAAGAIAKRKDYMKDNHTRNAPDAIVAIKHPDGQVMCINAEHISNLCSAAKQYGIKTFAMQKDITKAAVVANSKCGVVVMPMLPNVAKNLSTVGAVFDMTGAKEVPVETPFDDDTQKSLLRSLRVICKSIAQARRVARRG